ncbi:hypothetical protein GTZ99_01950 [Novosphingobium sp. FSY-8]|uniref:Lipoprotein n=1 Tax=Novosphingobium ovatum TaxID=1908523 RepID=A0ABW9X9W2_9SPHN|nr:hypothetical protein [Novosphingobium ovatum]NBC35318.1 hypothetical protein [Novosphingobium ovatum]
MVVRSGWQGMVAGVAAALAAPARGRAWAAVACVPAITLAGCGEAGNTDPVFQIAPAGALSRLAGSYMPDKAWEDAGFTTLAGRDEAGNAVWLFQDKGKHDLIRLIAEPKPAEGGGSHIYIRVEPAAGPAEGKVREILDKNADLNGLFVSSTVNHVIKTLSGEDKPLPPVDPAKLALLQGLVQDHGPSRMGPGGGGAAGATVLGGAQGGPKTTFIDTGVTPPPPGTQQIYRGVSDATPGRPDMSWEAKVGTLDPRMPGGQ